MLTHTVPTAEVLFKLLRSQKGTSAIPPSEVRKDPREQITRSTEQSKHSVINNKDT